MVCGFIVGASALVATADDRLIDKEEDVDTVVGDRLSFSIGKVVGAEKGL